MTQKKIARPDLEIPVEAWGTIKSATDKLRWLERVDACIASEIVERSFAHLAINIATNPKGVNSQTGLTWRSARTLADDTGLTKSTVKRLLEEAVTAGLLFVVRKGRPGRDGQSTMFRLATPEAENGPPVRRFERKKRPIHDPNDHPGNGPSVPPETAHPSHNKRPTSGTHLLRDIISVENKLRAAAEGGADTARGDSSNTTRAVRESTTTNSTSDAETPNQRAPSALIDTVAAKQPPSCRASENTGTVPASDADAARQHRMLFDIIRINFPHPVGDEAEALRLLAVALTLRGSRYVIEKTQSMANDLAAPTLCEVLRAIIEQSLPITSQQ